MSAWLELDLDLTWSQIQAQVLCVGSQTKWDGILFALLFFVPSSSVIRLLILVSKKERRKASDSFVPFHLFHAFPKVKSPQAIWGQLSRELASRPGLLRSGGLDIKGSLAGLYLSRSIAQTSQKGVRLDWRLNFILQFWGHLKSDFRSVFTCKILKTRST